MIGSLVNNYRVISILGEGGMGAVYLAQHPFMGRKAAIKVLRPELAADRQLVERFMNEARAANAIHHPNIIDIIDVGLLPSGIPYLMMEFLDGESLASRIARERPMAVADALEVAIQIASALFAAHGQDVVHRDLKPDNLFLISDARHPVGHVKVLDFGIAKLRGNLSGSAAMTQTGSMMGTPPYMSPEQCRGINDEIDHRTDVYALGIILYEMLAGEPPFVGQGWGEVALMHISQAPAPLRARNPEVSAELESVIMRALAKRAADRWASMAEIEAALRKAAMGGATRAAGRTATTAPAVQRSTALMMPSPTTTLQSATGQLATERSGDVVHADEDDLAQADGPPWWRRPRVMVGALALMAGALVVGVGGRRRSSGPGATAAGASITERRAAPATTAAARAPRTPVLQPSEPAAPGEPVRSPPPSAIATPVAPKGARAKKPGRRTDAPSKLAGQKAGAAAGCEPNFVLDAQGEKHFKPECF